MPERTSERVRGSLKASACSDLQKRAGAIAHSERPRVTSDDAKHDHRQQVVSESGTTGPHRPTPTRMPHGAAARPVPRDRMRVG